MIPRFVYVNGRYCPYAQARVHVEDRGYQFADGVYEVCAIRNGQILDAQPHLARLARSLSALQIRAPMSEVSLRNVMGETIRRNRVSDGLIYIQITRGVAERDHAFPDPETRSSLTIIARPIDRASADAKAEQGIAVSTAPDNRWARCDIKTTGLLGNVLGKQAAKEAGANEVWFVGRDGAVTEGGSTNAWIVDTQGRLRTRALSTQILPGVTRETVMSLLDQLNIQLSETAFTVEEAYAARECFSTSAVALLVPVVSIDGRPIGTGKPGPVAKRIRQSYLENVTLTGVRDL